MRTQQRKNIFRARIRQSVDSSTKFQFLGISRGRTLIEQSRAR